jgi:hypothetical protein
VPAEQVAPRKLIGLAGQLVHGSLEKTLTTISLDRIRIWQIRIWQIRIRQIRIWQIRIWAGDITGRATAIPGVSNSAP